MVITQQQHIQNVDIAVAVYSGNRAERAALEASWTQIQDALLEAESDKAILQEQLDRFESCFKTENEAPIHFTEVTEKDG